MSEQLSPMQTGDCAQCCADAGSAEAPGATRQITAAFSEFMKAAAAGGAIDARSKELIQFALVVYSRCAPCFRTHYPKALAMGISEAELEEAAWLVALGGAPVRMFFLEALAAYREQQPASCCG